MSVRSDDSDVKILDIPAEYRVDDLDIKKRYLFNGDMRVLAARVVRFIRERCPDVDAHTLDAYYEAIAERRFLPAGNTLVAGEKPLQPNCSIIGTVNESNYADVEKRCRVLWSNRIGVGFDLSEAEDPVSILRALSKANDEVCVGDWRPKRGNIATLSVEHPRLMEFVQCKSSSEEQANALYNFNISVAASNDFMERVLRGERAATSRLNAIAEHAHAYGDPGLVFIDRVQDGHERIVTAVPCGEQFMHNDETCNLGAVNLDAFVKDGRFDFEAYAATVRLATRFLDTMVDLLEIPDKAMAKRSRELRRVGLGVMGFATALRAMGIPYESDQALRMGARLAQRLTAEASATSMELAEECDEGHIWDNTRRNITVTCLAPTGGIRRLVANDGYSIEPLFSSEEKRASSEFEVRMTATWQRHIENAISKTITIPNDASRSRIAKLFLLAYREGCKGVTVYRDGSRSNQPIKVCDGDQCEIIRVKK